MAEEFAKIFVGFIRDYGYVALFVYFVLETAFILHFAPSEIVIPVAASVLVDSPVTFALFVLDATAGSTVGSYLLYYLFDQHGERVLTRYGRYIHLSEKEVDRSQRWFRKWGEHSVLWGRLFPFVRALISIPAGISHMNRNKFILYSAIGAAVFNIAITYLVYSGAKAAPSFHGILAYASSHPQFPVVVIVIGLITAIFLWRFVASKNSSR